MYTWYALLDQRPRVWIRWSGTPGFAVAVSAPMRKLWLEKLPWTPVEPKIRFSHVDSSSRVRGWPFSRINKGPSPPPRRCRIASMASIAQIGLRQRPMKMKQPFWNKRFWGFYVDTKWIWPKKIFLLLYPRQSNAPLGRKRIATVQWTQTIWESQKRLSDRPPRTLNDGADEDQESYEWSLNGIQWWEGE